jgi:hypothetical protein
MGAAGVAPIAGALIGAVIHKAVAGARDRDGGAARADATWLGGKGS